MDMIPPTSTYQQRGFTIVNGKRKYYSRSDGDSRQKLTAYLFEHKPDKPFAGAVQLVVKWCFPVSKGHYDGQPYSNKPDADNLCKMLLDVMTRLGFWKDDSQISSLVCEKFWAQRPGIYICISESV